MTDQFYLQDSRTNVGTGAMWWQAGGGYGTSIDRAEVFTREKAVQQYESRETDLPWPKTYIDERHHIGVDCQLVTPDDAVQAGAGESSFYAAFHREWDGNDLIWLSTAGGRTSDLAQAQKFSAAEPPALSANGFQVFPAAYIDGKARRVISVTRMDHKQALRGAGLKLKKIKPQKVRRNTYRCGPCGRILSELQNYSECPNCGAENRP